MEDAIEIKAKPGGLQMVDKIQASICIATYDSHERYKLLEKTLQSIFSQDVPFNFEVIVVDDGSPDYHIHKVCSSYPVHYHRINEKVGFGNPCIARNKAYRLASGDIIIAQSDEVVHVTSNTIERLVTDLVPGHFLLANVFMQKEDGSLGGEYTGIRHRPLPYFFLGSVRREDLYAIGGNDEEFIAGPSAEDAWFSECLIHGRSLIPTYSQEIVGHHLYHKSRSNPEVEKPSKSLIQKKRTEAIAGRIPWCASNGPWPYDGESEPLPPKKGINSIVVCVEYDDFLAVTLPKNKHHFDRTLVVTTWTDQKTQEVAAQNNCECFNTTAFHEKGAVFNKGAALEKGFDVLGRVGWICVWDADIIMPHVMAIQNLQKDCLHVPFRCLVNKPEDYLQYELEKTWEDLPVPVLLHEFSGYFHLFHASVMDPPWYSANWIHAGKYDSLFTQEFYRNRRKRLPFKVLHLGPKGIIPKSDFGTNWLGRVSPRIDTGKISPESSKRQQKTQQLIQDRLLRGISFSEKQEQIEGVSDASS